MDGAVPAIDAILLTSVSLFGEALQRCLSAAEDVCLLKVLGTVDEVRRSLPEITVSAVLVDVTQDVDFGEVRNLAAEYPNIAFIAVGLHEQGSDIVQAGRSGFVGYVARHASIAALVAAIVDAVAGRLSCSGEVASHLLRALFQQTELQSSDRWTDLYDSHGGLTRRQLDVARLMSLGLSNKEIARDLCLSLATVKHHVHHVLEKLHLDRRAQVSARLRDSVSPR